jgi:hypothetical protein
MKRFKSLMLLTIILLGNQFFSPEKLLAQSSPNYQILNLIPTTQDINTHPQIHSRHKYSYYGSTHRYVWDIVNTSGLLTFKYGYSTSSDNPSLTNVLILTSSQLSLNANLSANKFVDINNTAYFLDPSNSSLSLKVAGKIESNEIEVVNLDTESLESDEIKTNSLNVKVNNVADYVFNEDYNLRSLEELEQFIKVNKHLPDVPSATELEATGLDVAEMNNLLLQKIEELTLYVIELEKRVSYVKSENK